MIKLDIIVIGNQGSGKTSLTNRFVYNNEKEHLDDMFTHKYLPTVGVNLQKKVINVKDSNGGSHKALLNIWDTAGQEKFFSLTKSFFQRAQGVLVVYDITDKSSFTRIEELWLKQINDSCKPTTHKILIGNKSDLEEERDVNRDSGEELANRFQIPFIETSAKYGDGVEEAFMKLGQACFEEMYKRLEQDERENKFEIVAANGRKQMDCWDKFKESISSVFKRKNVGSSE